MLSSTSASSGIKLRDDFFWHLHILKAIPIPLLVLGCIWVTSLVLCFPPTQQEAGLAPKAAGYCTTIKTSLCNSWE